MWPVPMMNLLQAAASSDIHMPRLKNMEAIYYGSKGVAARFKNEFIPSRRCSGLTWL
jgi:hypothetical protein